MYKLKHFRLAGICQGSRVLYELDFNRNFYVIPIESILGKLLIVPVGYTRTIETLPFPTAAQSLSESARQPPAGFRGRMQDVVCQLVSIGIVPQCVMKANSDEEGTVQHGVQHGEVVLLYQLFQLE